MGKPAHASSTDLSTGKTSRRRFLARSGATLAGTALASSSSLAAPAAAGGKKIRMAVVGGRFGASFQWHEHPDCIVEAVSDLREDRRRTLARVYSPKKVYNSLEELVLDKDIDAVGIFTEGPNHVKHVELAMKHGKHVISAVPACWGTIEEAERLLEIVKSTGLTYMMAETSYYQQATITARKFYQQGLFGELFYCESHYDHPGLEVLFFDHGKRTWRYGMTPMWYPTHCTAHLIGITGERLTDVTCHGWGDDSPILKDNDYANPYWSEVAMFSTDRDHAFRVRVAWRIAARGGEIARWFGNKMSFHMHHPNGLPPVIVRSGKQMGKDDAGFDVALPNFEQYKQVEWYKTEMLPEPLRHNSGHQGSHTFLVHEFIRALVEDRDPAVDVYEALAYTVPGIVAHQSALEGGRQRKIPQFERPQPA